MTEITEIKHIPAGPDFLSQTHKAQHEAHEDRVKAVTNQLQDLNPILKIKAQEMDHFQYGLGVAIDLKSFTDLALKGDAKINLPDGWQVRLSKNGNTHKLVLPDGERAIFIRFTNRGFSKPLTKNRPTQQAPAPQKLGSKR